MLFRSSRAVHRFYDPESGVVAIDGRDIRTLNLRWLRSHVGLVTQMPVLVGGLAHALVPHPLTCVPLVAESNGIRFTALVVCLFVLGVGGGGNVLG